MSFVHGLLESLQSSRDQTPSEGKPCETADNGSIDYNQIIDDSKFSNGLDQLRELEYEAQSPQPPKASHASYLERVETVAHEAVNNLNTKPKWPKPTKTDELTIDMMYKVIVTKARTISKIEGLICDRSNTEIMTDKTCDIDVVTTNSNQIESNNRNEMNKSNHLPAEPWFQDVIKELESEKQTESNPTYLERLQAVAKQAINKLDKGVKWPKPNRTDKITLSIMREAFDIQQNAISTIHDLLYDKFCYNLDQKYNNNTSMSSNWKPGRREIHQHKLSHQIM